MKGLFSPCIHNPCPAPRSQLFAQLVVLQRASWLHGASGGRDNTNNTIPEKVSRCPPLAPPSPSPHFPSDPRQGVERSRCGRGGGSRDGVVARCVCTCVVIVVSHRQMSAVVLPEGGVGGPVQVALHVAVWETLAHVTLVPRGD